MRIDHCVMLISLARVRHVIVIAQGQGFMAVNRPESEGATANGGNRKWKRKRKVETENGNGKRKMEMVVTAIGM